MPQAFLSLLPYYLYCLGGYDLFRLPHLSPEKSSQTIEVKGWEHDDLPPPGALTNRR